MKDEEVKFFGFLFFFFSDSDFADALHRPSLNG